MPRRSVFSSLVSVVVATGALVACSSSTSDGTSSGTSGTTTQSACATDTRQDHYVAGLSKAAGSLSIALMDSSPAPPQKESNAMTLKVVDASGKPVDGATLSVTPFMPDHGHGSSVKPTVTPMGGGMYDVTNVYLPMPGLWRLTVTVQQPSVAAQNAAFQFCIDG